MRVRAGARACARGSQWFWPAESDFWEMRVLLGFTPVMTFGNFWLLAKPVKFYRRAYMFWWNWFSGFEKNTSFELSRTNILCDETDETKKSPHKKILTFQEWVIILRSIVATWTLNHTWFRIMTISYRKPKNLNRLRISLAPTKFYSLQHQLLELDLTRLTFFGVRYVLTYSPNHSSTQDVKHLDHRWSMKYWSDIRRPPGCYVLHCKTCPCHWENQITCLETQV